MTAKHLTRHMNASPKLKVFVLLFGLLECSGFRGSPWGLRRSHGNYLRHGREATLSIPSAEPHLGRPRRLVTMGGFGPDRPDPKPPTTGEALARTMQSAYDELRREGGTVAQVHARIKGSDRWYVVGHVCTETGKTAEGIQGQKRLILDHAAKMYMDLNSKKLTLETGYSMEGTSEVVPCKAKYSGEKVGVALDPLPKGPFFRKVLEGGVNTQLEDAKASASVSKTKFGS